MSCVPDNFYEQVYNIVSQVPSGTVVTYKSIAVLMGYPQHARLVGRALKLVPKNLNIPCHRVVNDLSPTGLSRKNYYPEKEYRLHQRDM